MFTCLEKRQPTIITTAPVVHKEFVPILAFIIWTQHYVSFKYSARKVSILTMQCIGTVFIYYLKMTAKVNLFADAEFVSKGKGRY